MTRKRYVKLMMASGWDRNTANYIGIDPSKCHPCVPQERRLIAWAYRGSFPFKSYKQAWENDKMLVAIQRMYDGLPPLKAGCEKENVDEY